MSAPLPSVAARVLEIWFGPLDAPGYPEQRMSVWFGKDPAFDEALREEFGETLAAIAAGDDDPAPWTATPRGLLARILLLDQFTRNIHRGTAQMYGLDDEAVDLTLLALHRGDDRALTLTERPFVLMPLMHAENIALQRHCVRCFEALVEESGGADGPKANLTYAHAHLDIVERFGRFPHRNALLGRETTLAEARFLMTPGSSF